ncbi:MAG: TolC family protein [Verrucomicrobiae bacterium]|nr:TolC family protein [Verrucomicrobiae bacterium]
MPLFGGDYAPSSPDQAWNPPRLGEYEQELASLQTHSDASRVAVDSEKIYDLPALIDLAERSHPETRGAWERARQAAAAVGLAQSTYYPYLAASAAAGYERAFVPFPELQLGPAPTAVSIKGGGTLTTEAAAEGGALNLKWLLFDFGERKAAVTEAREKLMMANVSFNAIHQKIVFDVTQRFYEFDAARQKVATAESSLSAAQTVAEAAQLRLTNGLATKPEALQAEQQEAQAAFDLAAARGGLGDARVALGESLGIMPTTKLQVAAAPEKLPAENLDDSLAALMDRALSQRPDLVARLADVRASRAEIKKVRAEYYPKVSLGAKAGISELDVRAGSSPFFGGNERVYGVGLAIDLPIFDGFARTKKLSIAESELNAAESELAGARDQVVREVWKAYTDFKTAFYQQDSAEKLLSASQGAFDASLEAYRQGLGTYVDVVNAQRNLAVARGVMVDTRAAIFTSRTALALSIGGLAQPVSANPIPR